MSEPGVKRRETISSKLVLPPGVKVVAGRIAMDISQLAGTIVDDSQAELTGNWQSTGSLSGFVGQGYVYTNDPSATAKYEIDVKKDGRYDVRITWQPHPNRAKSMRVEVHHGGTSDSFLIDQTKPVNGGESFQSLGQFEFQSDRPALLVIHAKDAKGTVHADAIQVVEILNGD